MNNLPHYSLVQTLRIADLVAYLEGTGWQRVRGTNGRWMVFQRALDNTDEPLEIVLPHNTEAPDLPLYLASAVNTLSLLRDSEPEETVAAISAYNLDVLRIRNPHTGDYYSIPLRVSAQQVNNCRNLVAFAASSEREPRAHFNQVSQTGHEMVEHFRFGQTFAGSFGYTIESRLIRSAVIQKSLFTESRAQLILPIERRVMERIARGLLSINDMRTSKDWERLVHNYPAGLNANMCQALIAISVGKQIELEYRIQWSPKITPSPDVREIQTILLNRSDYDILEQVAQKLREIDPEQVTIRGQVTDLSAKNNPFGLQEVPRSATIRWTNRPERPIDVRVDNLRVEDYNAAWNAHGKWHMVEVRGELLRKGQEWRLYNYHDFKIIDS